MQKLKEPKPTPSGYAAGGLRASDGIRYEVLPTGQIVRRERKPGKAELKRLKKAHRQARLSANGKRKTENRSNSCERD